jgi:hypothetical protein
MKIYTHVNPDLDAVTSVWLYRNFILPLQSIVQEGPLKAPEVTFVPANWDGAGMEKGDVALDIDAGGKGIKGKKLSDGRVMSCFTSLMENYLTKVQKMILRPLGEYVDAQDSTGDAVLTILSEADFYLDHVGGDGFYRPWRRSDVPASLRVSTLTSVLGAIARHANGDHQKTIELFSIILDGIYANGQDRLSAESEAFRAIHWKHVALIRDARYMATNGILFERGARFVIFVDGHNLGVLRKDTETVHLGKVVEPIIRKLAPGELHEWFFHSAGFLAARGTRKAPSQMPSMVDPERLAEAISIATL